MKESTNPLLLPPPMTYIGWGAAQHLKSILISRVPKRILLVVDPILPQIDSFHELLQILMDTGVYYEVYTDIIPEPTVETADKLINYARRGEFDWVIGVGGGSALDLAKLAAVLMNNKGNVTDYLNLTGTRKIQQKGAYCVLMPTTSGTGSEVTDISVLSLGHTKDVVTHRYLQADVAIVDPQFTMSVPAKVTAATGADALTHAIEAYLSVNRQPYSDALALEAIRLIVGALPTAVKNGDDREARTAMAYGSYFAGIAFYNAGVGAVHALAYPLGGEFHIAHGDSNAVMLPYVLRYIYKHCAQRLVDIFQMWKPGALQDLDNKHTDTIALLCVDELALLMKSIGVPETLQGFGIPADALGSLATDGVKQKRLLARCPMELDENDIYNIYASAFYGKMYDGLCKTMNHE